MLETVKLPNQPEMNMPDLPSEKTMYQAIADKDTSFEGIFVVAVKTTGIFCRPGCSARTPKRENVEFFGQPREALEHGYRPCKVCKPMNIRGEVPDWLKPLLEEINAEPGIRLKDQDIRERGLDKSVMASRSLVQRSIPATNRSAGLGSRLRRSPTLLRLRAHPRAWSR